MNTNRYECTQGKVTIVAGSNSCVFVQIRGPFTQFDLP